MIDIEEYNSIHNDIAKLFKAFNATFKIDSFENNYGGGITIYFSYEINSIPRHGNYYFNILESFHKSNNNELRIKKEGFGHFIENLGDSIISQDATDSKRHFVYYMMYKIYEGDDFNEHMGNVIAHIESYVREKKDDIISSCKREAKQRILTSINNFNTEYKEAILSEIIREEKVNFLK